MRAEEKVVIYSAAERKYCEGLLAGFEASHPGIEVDFVFGISTALHQRYLAELQAGEPQADILWSSAMDLQLGLVLAGKALPYRSPEAGSLPSSAVCRDLAYATTVEPLFTLVNRDYFDVDVPAGSLGEIAEALRADPQRFRTRVACYDIERNGLGFLALLHESGRDADFDGFMSVLAQCRPKIFGSNPTLVEEVASGRAALGYHVLGSYAVRAVRAHPSLAIATSKVPPLAVSRVAFISRCAPHPDAAKLFLDYLLSREGQQQLLEARLFPICRGAPSEPARGVNSVTPIGIDRGFDRLLDPQRRRALLSRWQVAVAGDQA